MSVMVGIARLGGRRTRRTFLSLLVGAFPAAAQRGAGFRSDWKRYSDPATEFEVLRLTEPSYSSYLPAYYGRAVSRRRTFMLFSSDRGGSLQAFRMNLRNGEWQQLTDARQLNSASLTLLPDERSFCYLDGDTLRQASFFSLRGRDVYQIPEGWQPGRGCSISGDGVHAALVESREGVYRLRLIRIDNGNAITVTESKEPLSDPAPRPGRAGLLYRKGENSLWLVNYDGGQDRPLKLAPGGAGPARWASDGRTVLYINFPADRRQLNAIREHTPDANFDALVAPTSQFVHFGLNSDSSVFVGSSGSKASPYVLILLRSTKRELTLCEHGASDPSMVAPIFSADSQRVYFQSDRHGKPALYSMAIEQLVEKTES